jgi:hypothetical protein
MIYNVKLSNKNRDDVIHHILLNKSKGVYRVIDIGGGVLNNWATPYVDAMIDFNYINTDVIIDKNIKIFNFDITDHTKYNDLLRYVAINGKFDFSICTHVLEDIINPVFVCKQMSMIANEGYVSFPSKYKEFYRFEGPYRGYIHHRWIFDVDHNNTNNNTSNITSNTNHTNTNHNTTNNTNTTNNNTSTIIAYPKINYIENYIFDRLANNSPDLQDLSFYWKDSIEMTYLNSNFLGPDVDSVIGYYKRLL